MATFHAFFQQNDLPVIQTRPFAAYTVSQKTGPLLFLL